MRERRKRRGKIEKRKEIKIEQIEKEIDRKTEKAGGEPTRIESGLPLNQATRHRKVWESTLFLPEKAVGDRDSRQPESP